jgi:LEA14-like dessication related protein
MCSRLRAAVGVLVACLLAGCAGIFGPVENPSISITSLKLLPAEGGEQRVEVGLRIMNPNGFPLEAKGIVLEAGFNDIPLLRGAVPTPPVVPAYGESQMNVMLSASLLNGIRLISAIVKHPDDPLRYRLEARVDLSKPIGRTLTILEQGEIAARPPAPPAGQGAQ